MKYHEFQQLVAEMREAQKAYFKRREPERLSAAKEREGEVDRVLDKLRSPSLFDDAEDVLVDPIDQRIVIVIDTVPAGGFRAYSVQIPALSAEAETVQEVLWRVQETYRELVRRNGEKE